MALSDQQIMLLEQLTYLDSDGVSSVSDYIIKYKENDEYGAVIKAISNDPDLCGLKLVGKQDGILVFNDPQEPARAIVAFKGTYSSQEWADNLYGLATPDTDVQKKALDFIESLDPKYENVTVTGHSKGGNKAMYCAILSDKVDRCISLDGQGFSEDFYEKYATEVEDKASVITRYSLDSDFVNILLRDVPGAKSFYIANDGRYTGGDNHQPYALLTFDKDGNLLPLEKTLTEQAPGFTYLEEFTEWLSRTMTDSDKEIVADFLGPLLGMLRDSDVENPYIFRMPDGTVFSKDNVIEYIRVNPAALGIILGYAEVYIKENDLNQEQIESLIAAFAGLDYSELQQMAAKEIDNSDMNLQFAVLLIALTDVLVKGVGFLDKALDTNVVADIVIWLSNTLAKVFERFGISVDIAGFDLVTIFSIAKSTSASVSSASGSIRTTEINGNDYNYSAELYNAIIDTMNSINEKVSEVCASSWNSYSGHSWFGKLLISKAVEGINKYAGYIQENNSESKNQIETIFRNAEQIDARHAEKIGYIQEDISNVISTMRILGAR